MDIGSWGVKLGALLLAAVLWLHAMTEQAYKRELQIRLIIENPETPPKSKPIVALASGNVSDFVTVKVSGTGKDLLQIEPEDYALHVETEGHVGASRTYRLNVGQIESTTGRNNIQFEEVLDPKELVVHFDRLVEKEVEVHYLADLRSASAHVIVGQPELEPQSVRLLGPRSILDTMKIIQTQQISMFDLREDVNRLIDVRAGLPKAVSVNPNSVRLIADVQILAEDEIVNVPVSIRDFKDDSLRTEPASVKVKLRGGVDVISNIDPLVDLSLYVQYRPAYEGLYDIHNDNHHPNFEILSIQPNQIEIIED